MPSGAHMPLLTSTPSGLRVDRAAQRLSGLIPPANSQPYLLRILGNLNWAQSNASPLQRRLMSFKTLLCIKNSLSDGQIAIKLYKNYAFTCHPLHYLPEPNQLENTLHRELCLKGSHSHLHGEHILHDFPELKMGKLPANQIHEAALSKVKI